MSARVRAGSLALALLTVACAAPLQATQPTVATPVPAGPGASSSIRGQVPTPTVFVPPQASVLPADAAPPTPFAVGGALPAAPSVTPLPPATPAIPTMAPPPRPELDAGSQAAATANAATAVAQSTRMSATATARPAQVIRIQDLAFQPATLTVPPGTAVIWQNADRVMHQVKGGEFDSGRLAAGISWSSIMERPGRYAFICSFHPTMRAEITVSPDTTRPVHLGS